jgi:hypothetical protein
MDRTSTAAIIDIIIDITLHIIPAITPAIIPDIIPAITPAIMAGIMAVAVIMAVIMVVADIMEGITRSVANLQEVAWDGNDFSERTKSSKAGFGRPFAFMKLIWSGVSSALGSSSEFRTEMTCRSKDPGQEWIYLRPDWIMYHPAGTEILDTRRIR